MTFRVVVYDSAIQRMLLPTGDIGRHYSAVARETRDTMAANAPKQSGRLAASHHYRIRPRKDSIVIRVFNDAEHALWVHGGTGIHGPYHRRIRSTTGQSMPMGTAGAMFIRRSTAGQKGNPWMTRSLAEVGARHGIV